MGSKSFGWDLLNRMTSYNSTTYAYQADGMRITKSNSTGSTSYRYDGQMGMEDIDYAANGSTSKVTDYGVGVRGIDAMYLTQNGTTTATYPIYDSHGNMLSTLTKQGTNSYSFSALRTYDAWGNVRHGAQTCDPKGRYCANLGHKQDDESGLIYMRARYYESGSGRFISQDSSHAGRNWFIYCSDNPVSCGDYDGKNILPDFLFPWQTELNFILSVEAGVFFVAAIYLLVTAVTPTQLALAIGALEMTVLFAGAAFAGTNLSASWGSLDMGCTLAIEASLEWVTKTITNDAIASAAGLKTCASLAVGAALSYSMMLTAEMFSEVWDQ